MNRTLFFSLTSSSFCLSETHGKSRALRAFLSFFLLPSLFSPSIYACLLVAAMARTVWTFFWIVLVVWGLVLVDMGDVDEEERVVALGGDATGDGAASGDDGAAGVGGVGGAPPRALEVAESSRPRDIPDDSSITEEGQGSGGGDMEDAFRDLPELSSRGRAARLRQSTLLEVFASSSQMGQPDLGADEAMDEEGDDSDEEFVVGEEPAEEDEEEAGADEAGEPTMQGLHPTKRHRRLQGVGAFGWDTLTGGGPLEGYRRCPTTMLCFRTIPAR